MGGLADVVGALPKYQNKLGYSAAVIIPKYGTAWFKEQKVKQVFESYVMLGSHAVWFNIELVESHNDGFAFYLANIPQFFDRPGVYGVPGGHFFWDQPERNAVFQRAVLVWVRAMAEKPEILHCHDHHTGLIPFFLKHAYEFKEISHISCFFTIHNGRYRGQYGWDRKPILPHYPEHMGNMLDWDGMINPLASAIRCCDWFTTVSPGYLDDLKHMSNYFSGLINSESGKATGVLNGIDDDVWNPKTDTRIHSKLMRSVSAYKKKNKTALCSEFSLKPSLPLFTFIGRIAPQKGTYLLPEAIRKYLGSGQQATFFFLGSGDPAVEYEIEELCREYPAHCATYKGYNEDLAHQLYASSDFLLMTSEEEPCGLNQLYSLRYGTIPIVNPVGGLRDTIIDMDEENGYGFWLFDFSPEGVAVALTRAANLFQDAEKFSDTRKNIMKLDFSWTKSAQEYLNLYYNLI